jgi:hypothetical protein
MHRYIFATLFFLSTGCGPDTTNESDGTTSMEENTIDLGDVKVVLWCQYVQDQDGKQHGTACKVCDSTKKCCIIDVYDNVCLDECPGWGSMCEADDHACLQVAPDDEGHPSGVKVCWPE